jgi:O-antigen ligase
LDVNSLPYKFNRFLLTLIAAAPIVGYFLYTFLSIDFFKIMQFLSYIGIILLLVFRSNSIPIKFPRYLLFYFIFVLYVYYSTFVQLGRDFKPIYLVDSMLGGLSYMFIIENVYITKRHFKLLLNISMFVLIIAVIVIVVQELIDPTFMVKSDFRRLNLLTGSDSNNNRLVSIYTWIGGLSEVGFSFVPILIIVVEHFYRSDKKKYIFWILIGLIYAFLSKARWIMVNTILVFALLIVNQRNKVQHFIKYLVLIPFFFAISFFVLEAVGINAMGIVNERILENDKKNVSETSAGTRLLAFKAFGALYWDKPIFGHGSSKYGMGGTGKQDYKLRSFLKGRSAQIHVGYLSLFYMYGLIGGFFFVAFIFLILRKLFINAKKTGIWSPFLGFLGFALANWTLVIFSFYQMGFIMAMVVYKYYNQEDVLNNSLNA